MGVEHGHRLMDTASFTRAVVRRCYGHEEQPFTLAIAGYGTGKSHLGIALASLLANSDGEATTSILSSLQAADETIGSEVRALLDEANQPCLVLALNGMQSFDLTAEITRQIIRNLKTRGLDTKPLDDLRPRFSQAANLIRMSSADVITEMLAACELGSVDGLLKGLEQQNEQVYASVHDFFAARRVTISALTGESLRDVIDVTVRQYCGDGKPYRSLVVLFDEFGRYTEFATVRSQIAGSGVLQDLFEGIQAHSNRVCFVGLIQFELNAYVQRISRIAPEHKNEILRYVTRYQAANRAYLSINLETLIASLLEKLQPEALDRRFDLAESRKESLTTMQNLARWFPEARNHRLWCDPDQFHSVIRKGCWPLSALSTWFLFYLAAAGKHLQERSALALLGDAITRHEADEVPAEMTWALAPAQLWSGALEQELLSSEDSGQQGSIMHALASVTARHGARLTEDLQRILRSVVLASKMGLQAASRSDAVAALAELSGLSSDAATEAIHLLEEEYNVLEWDEAFKEFDILGDAVPRTQFLSFVRQRVATSYDEAGKARLFASKAADWCDLLIDLDCDFAEENHITTREWRYSGVTSSLDLLPMQIKLAADRWKNSLGVDDPRGIIIYCYVEPSRDPVLVMSDAGKLLRAAAREAAAPLLPILVVLLCDEQGDMGQALAEVAVLEEAVSDEDRVRFGNLIPAHKQKVRQTVRDQVEGMLKQRRYVTGATEALESHRLSRAGTELFSKIYKSAIPFPFDGFSTARGNAADTCQDLTAELLAGKLDFDGVIAKPVKTKNRAITVLKDTWGIFTKNGDISRRPSHPALRRITEKWDDVLASDEGRLQVCNALRQLCLPPHGANIASAGLILGVFVAPRAKKLVAVRGGQQIDISQLLQDGFFKGKFIDLMALDGVDLVSIGEASSEWETLLDEWDQAQTYVDRSQYLERCIELKTRIPVPPALRYRCDHLEQRGAEAKVALEQMENAQNEACERVEYGLERKDVGKLAWGASELVTLSAKMATEREVSPWADWQKNELRPHIERARQGLIQIFQEWLVRQVPASDSPSAVGDWKHKMLKLIGGNLKMLGLESQYEELEQRVQNLVRNAETVAEAHQLVRSVEDWLSQNADACRIVRIAGIRGLRDVGRDYTAKLQGMSKRVDLATVSEVRSRLASFLNTIKEAESTAMGRASSLWHAHLKAPDDLDKLLGEVDDLTRIFEACAEDIKDLQILARGLRAYQHCYTQLQDSRLTWTEFEQLAGTLEKQVTSEFGEGELPWPADEVVRNFVKTLSRARKEQGKTWLEALETETTALATMSTADASRLHERASNPPACLTEQQASQSHSIGRKVERHLNVLAVEWLLERFKALPKEARSAFLKAASRIDDV